MPQIETRIRLIVREEMRQQFEEVWLPRLRAMMKDLLSKFARCASRWNALKPMWG